tara:strand:- start:1030 stop:1557 length:528 start_codon:yes stop_codon:yes gene_type:complete
MDNMQLEIEIDGFDCNSWPKLTIRQNNKTVYEQFVINSHTVDMQLENKPFSIGMENKSFGDNDVWDTKTDADGNITADKYLVIKKISIDDVNFENNLRKIPYQRAEHGPTIIHDQTIRFNGYWQIDTKDNPYNWIIDLANKRESENRTVSYFSDYQSHSNYDDHHKVIAEIREMI